MQISLCWGVAPTNDVRYTAGKRNHTVHTPPYSSENISLQKISRGHRGKTSVVDRAPGSIGFLYQQLVRKVKVFLAEKTMCFLTVSSKPCLETHIRSII